MKWSWHAQHSNFIDWSELSVHWPVNSWNNNPRVAPVSSIEWVEIINRQMQGYGMSDMVIYNICNLICSCQVEYALQLQTDNAADHKSSTSWLTRWPAFLEFTRELTLLLLYSYFSHKCSIVMLTSRSIDTSIVLCNIRENRHKQMLWKFSPNGRIWRSAEQPNLLLKFVHSLWHSMIRSQIELFRYIVECRWTHIVLSYLWYTINRKCNFFYDKKIIIIFKNPPISRMNALHVCNGNSNQDLIGIFCACVPRTWASLLVKDITIICSRCPQHNKWMADLRRLDWTSRCVCEMMIIIRCCLK